VTGRYTTAIEQLGKESPELRVGAVYALERIARDSAADRLTMVEVLTAFIRLRAALSPGTDERERPTDPAAKFPTARDMTAAAKNLRDRAPHIQAAMTVLDAWPASIGDLADG
jgi:hypothetical protein